VIERELLDYDFDEEAFGFEEPPRAELPSVAWGQRLAVASMALGGLFLLVQLLSGRWLGSWLGLLGSALPLIGGARVYFWLNARRREPGIHHDGIFFSSSMNRGWIGWGLGIVMTGFYVVLYWFGDRLERGVEWISPLAGLLGVTADRWFLYGFLYTAAILVFGTRMLVKYRHNRYQQVRTLSVMFFQFGFAFLLPQLLKAFQQPEFYFTYFWPLKPEYLYPWNARDLWAQPGGIGIFMVLWGGAMTFLATPILTFFYGKRWYCSWVCGCGGLAETLGDPWRQLSSKSTLSWKLERAIIYTVLALVSLTTISLWINAQSEGRWLAGFSTELSRWYGFYIGALFAGVIGVGFYPILGSRVWCRFGCPMAAILGIFQRFFSRFRITTNGDQCMSCGNCSTYCEMGIDVRAYAQESKNIVRASCVGCGVCAAVCPRGVLRLENGTTWADRYPGSDRPAEAFWEAVRKAGVYGD